MSPALRALVDADNRRPGPPDGVRAGVYAALGVSMGVLPASLRSPESRQGAVG